MSSNILASRKDFQRMLLVLLLSFTIIKNASARFPIEQPSNLISPGSILLDEVCKNVDTTLRKVFNYVIRSQSKLCSLSDLNSKQFLELYRSGNRYMSSYTT